LDPLTHTLVGANLASTRLGDKTPLAAAALIIGANLPDVDAILYFTGHQDLALGFRRGWTHGALALLVLPFLQTALLMLYARARRIDVHARWLLALSALAILTHPTLDWLNNYGMRWLMPFRGTWFYGDSVYIMDPWLWMFLGVGWLISRRPTRMLVLLFIFFAAAIVWVVSRRSGAYLPIVAMVIITLLGALVVKWNVRRHTAATIALAISVLYIGARMGIHYYTADHVRRLLNAERVMASPHPIDARLWDIVAQTGDVYRYGRFSWRAPAGLTLNPHQIPLPKDSREWRVAQNAPHVRGFMSWVRFPWYEIERSGGKTRVLIHDARYAVRRRPGGGFGGVEVTID
jgi:inner membrane protein